MSGSVLAFVALALVGGAAYDWFRRIERVEIPENRVPHLGAFGGGALLAGVALVLGTNVVATAAALIALIGGGTFVGLAALSAQARVLPSYGVGDPIPAFQALDEHEKPFDSATLAGKPYLLKFFRGHW